MNFEEIRSIQKNISEKLTKLQEEGLDFQTMRNLQKEVSSGLISLGEKMNPTHPTPVYDQLKNGDFIDLPADQFIEKLKEAAKELGEEDSLTERIIDPANEWKKKREGVAVEGTEQEIDAIDQIINREDPALESAKPKLDVGADIILPGIVVSKDEKSVTVGFPFDDTWNSKEDPIVSSFEMDEKDLSDLEVDDDIMIDAEVIESKIKDDSIFYGLKLFVTDKSEDAPDNSVYVLEKDVLESMINLDDDDDLATESTVTERGLALEKSKNVDEKLWKYAKKIALKAMCDKEPSGDNEKDNKALTDADAWGFVQDRYDKLESGKIKPKKETATESTDPEKPIEDPAIESTDQEIEDDEETII